MRVQSIHNRYVASAATTEICGISSFINASAVFLFSHKYARSSSSHAPPFVNAATGAVNANTFGSATSSVLSPLLTCQRIVSSGTMTAAVWIPARLKALVAATQVMLFFLQFSDTDANGI